MSFNTQQNSTETCIILSTLVTIGLMYTIQVSRIWPSLCNINVCRVKLENSSFQYLNVHWLLNELPVHGCNYGVQWSTDPKK